jgi:PIN like domain
MPPTMRERFVSFQRKSQKDFVQIWSIAEFTFDANVLLNLYGSPLLVVDQFDEYLTFLSDRFYLTDQVVLEFYRNREKVINQARNSVLALNEVLTSIPAAFSVKAHADLTKLMETEAKNLDKFLADGDRVEKIISDAVGDRIDPPLKDVISLYSDIDRRYLANIPPGFADVAEKEDYKKYGDAILWLQVIEHQKRTKKPLVLVTSDTKYDWWIKDNQNKTVGPRVELGHEMWEQCGVQFHLYTFKQFLTYAAEHISTKDSSKKTGEEAVKVVEQLEQQREAVSQSNADASRLAEALSNASVLGNLSPHPSESHSDMIRKWVSPDFQNFREFQTELDRLRSNTIQNPPSSTSLRAYIDAIDTAKQWRSASSQLAEDYRRAMHQPENIRSLIDRLTSTHRPLPPVTGETANGSPRKPDQKVARKKSLKRRFSKKI